MSYDVNSQSYQSSNLMRTHKQIGWPGLTQMAVSREPDTRVWIVRADGQVLVKLFDPAENVLGWSRVITDGVIESVAVLPGDDEDEVYFMVARTVGGNTVRYLEKLSSVMLDDAADATQVDSFVQWSGAATTTIPGSGISPVARSRCSPMGRRRRMLSSRRMVRSRCGLRSLASSLASSTRAGI